MKKLLVVFFLLYFSIALYAELPKVLDTFEPEYFHNKVNAVRVGIDDEKLFIFQPDDPKPATASVVLFLRGWTFHAPSFYQSWINHIVRRGHIVIFPEFQGNGSSAKDFTINAARSLKEGLRFLEDRKGVIPDRENMIILGHECGAVIAANLAVINKRIKLPVPKALMLIEPSRSPSDEEGTAIPLANLSKIKQDTYLLMVVGEDDTKNGMGTAIDLFYRCSGIPSDNKIFLTALTDVRGVPALVGDSISPTAPNWRESERAIEKYKNDFIRSYRDPFNNRILRGKGVDFQDFSGFWRLFDKLCYVGFNGFYRDSFFLEKNPDFRTLGKFSDGRAIRGFLATKRP
ncbi:MAG: hypothetical protein HQM08_15340 [Candidatus Riflebacteria bacterium]|nr:hypothetical protein [Candidatus Riflebacteria bacterium]